jgi:hypothetical protein
MNRATALVATVLAAVLAIAAASCSKANPAAPTPLPAISQATSGSVGAPATGPASPTAVLAVGVTEVRGVIRDIDVKAWSFTLVSREAGRAVTVRATERTVIMGPGQDSRAGIRFAKLSNGLSVMVQGKVERGILMARVIAVVREPR